MIELPGSFSGMLISLKPPSDRRRANARRWQFISLKLGPEALVNKVVCEVLLFSLMVLMYRSNKTDPIHGGLAETTFFSSLPTDHVRLGNTKILNASPKS
jgi:hypothetical protein